MEVKDKLDSRNDFVFLDVRSPGEWDTCRIEAQQGRLIPLSELRARLDELPRSLEIVIFCQTSSRAYQAQRILEGKGFKDIKFMDGSIAAWPYEVSGIRLGPDE
jgi:rhodanese-related sulfurtransferase